VPLVELPEGALPVSAAWLSGVTVEGVEALSGGGGRLPAFAISLSGLGLLSSVRGGNGVRGASVDSGASASAGGEVSGCLVSSAITSGTYTLTYFALSQAFRQDRAQNLQLRLLQNVNAMGTANGTVKWFVTCDLRHCQ